MLLADYHTHTDFSHGRGSVEDNVREAVRIGLKKICITDHGGGHLLYGVRGKALLEQRRLIDTLKEKYEGQIEIFMGVEANLTGDGFTDLPKDRGIFDYILLGYHKGIFPRDGLAVQWIWRQIAGHKPERQALRNAQALVHAAENAGCIFAFSHPGTHIPEDIACLAKFAARTGVYLELNEHHDPMPVENIRIAAAEGAKFILSSDAHRPQDVGKVPNALEAARKAQVLEKVVNWSENGTETNALP